MARKLPVIVADDCRACGACCISDDDDDDVYVDLTDEDAGRMSPAFRRRAVVDKRASTSDPWLSLRTKRDSSGNCVCIALRGTVGSRVSCGIYERRPDGCRAFRPGSTDCRQARRDAELD